MNTLSIIDRPCAKFNHRPQGSSPQVIVIHFSATMTTEEIFDIFIDGPLELSSHYVIGDRGHVYRLVDESMRAWHAGVSEFQGIPDVNDFSIGIELRNAGRLIPAPGGSGYRTILGVPFHGGNKIHFTDGSWWERYAEPQLAALEALCGQIISRHSIPLSHIVGHSDIALPRGRKIDPGPLFEWVRLRRTLTQWSGGAR